MTQTDLFPPPEDLGRVADAVRLAGMMPFLAQQTAKMINEVEGRVFRAIRDLTITPEMALNAWMEVHSHRKLLKSLETNLKIGQSLGEKHRSALQAGLPNPIYSASSP